MAKPTKKLIPREDRLTINREFASVDAFIAEYVTNISRSGVFIKTRAPLAPGTKVNVAAGHLPIKGDSKAKVTIIEFADFRCPFCERFHNDAVKGILQDYVASGKVKFYFRNFAFLGPASTAAHMAGECANEQGKFWAMHDWFYDHQADESNTEYYSNANLIKYAGQVGGINISKFTSCLNSNKYATNISQDMAEGQQVGVGGTPTIYINGKQLVGAQPYATVKAAIDLELAGK